MEKRKWVNCDLPKETAGRFKEYLRDNGLWKHELCEPSENGNYIHFECKLTEAEIESAEAFIEERC